MNVWISDSALLGELAEALAGGDCVAVAREADTLAVVHPYAHDEKEARSELTFFLRAWSSRHPQVTVELVG